MPQISAHSPSRTAAFAHEHPVGGLEDERERGALLEAERLGEWVQLAGGDRLQLAVRAVGVLADDGDPVVVRDARVDDDALPELETLDPVAERDDDARAVGAEDARLRNRGQTLANPDVEVVEAGRAEADEHLARAGLRIGDVLDAEDLRPAVLVDAHGLHGQNPRMTAAELSRLAAEVGIDVVGAAPAAAYEETERHIVERRERGLFADMHFTMARPEVSCHPERLLEGAKTVVSAALCYYVPGPEPGVDEGRLPRYAWRDHYADLRQRLTELGERLGGSYRVLVDSNDHVDREGAVRSGVAFYGKNTLAITRRFGSWVVLGTLVTDVEIEPTPALELDCGSCRLCIDACPTGALDEPGVLDSNRCLSYWTQAPESDPGGVPDGARGFGVRLRHLPGRVPLEPRHREAPCRSLSGGRCDADRLAAGLARAGRRVARVRARSSVRPSKRRSMAPAQRPRRDRERGERRARPARRAERGRRRPDAAGHGRVGARPDRGARRMSAGAGEPGRLAILVHEVRSPVAALQVVADAARHQDLEPSALRDVVALALAACSGIERVVTDVAVASVRLEEVDAGSLVRAAAAAASLSGARVRAQVTPGLPPVSADPLRLRQALDSLVSNALAHGARPDEEVVVSAATDGTRVLLAVADAGEGIPPADQTRIFEGVRLDGSASGAGLGLMIARAIAEGHGGTLTVESAPGHGSTFTLALPLGD